MNNKIEKQWKYKGLDCLIFAIPVGHRCGYVRIPNDHPFFGLHFQDKIPGLETNLEICVNDSFNSMLIAICGDRELMENHSQTIDGNVNVHGGITFCGEFNSMYKINGWWIGFDCAHCDDELDTSIMCENHLEVHNQIQAIIIKNRIKYAGKNIPNHKILWTTHLVQSEVENLADQLIDFKIKNPNCLKNTS
jgi:hypothetical protein